MACHNPAYVVSEYLSLNQIAYYSEALYQAFIETQFWGLGYIEFSRGEDEPGLPVPSGGFWGLSYTKFPAGEDDQDNWIAVMRTGDYRDGREMRTGQPVIFPEIQVRIRSRSDDEAMDKGFQVLNKMNSQLTPVNVTIDGRTYKLSNLSVRTEPTFLLEEDFNQRRHYVMTARVTIEG